VIMSIEQLALDIFHGKKVLFITGAGLSVASGISPYRGAKNAIWNQYVTEWATKQRYLSNPLKWWNDFWLRTHETPEFLEADPNLGHKSIDWIVKTFGSKVITQNIDTLHIKSGMRESDLVEIHGRLQHYRCTNSRCCYSSKESIEGLDLDAIAQPGTSLWKNNLKLRVPPTCDLCGYGILPQSLLFDEDYDSHNFYNVETAEQWIEDHDILVFVGTSFSVGITHQALDTATKRGKTIYNFNLYEEDLGMDVNMHHILGKSEVTLPLLAKNLWLLYSRPRIWSPRPVDRNSEPQRFFISDYSPIFHSMDYELSI